MTSTAAPCLGTRSDARGRLRDATHATHERMHLLPQFRAIEAQALDSAGYARLLTALHAYHSSVADAAAGAGLGHLSSSAVRTEALGRDLATLGGAPATGHRELRTREDRASVLGALYVAEGSMLGGRVIARQLDYLFADKPAGRSFFIGTRADGARWRAFLAALEEANDGEKALQRMVGGAEASFVHFDICIGMYG